MTNRPIITALEYAQLHGIDEPDTVQRWARTGQLPGAYKSPDTVKGTWLIPAGCPRPQLAPGRPKRGE